jgi:6-phosphogluconolactonase
MNQMLKFTEREIIICRDVDELNRKAAERFIALAVDAVSRSGRFTVALSGSSTPKALMVRENLLSRIPIPSENIHRMMAEKEPEQARKEYEEHLKQFFRLPASCPDSM